MAVIGEHEKMGRRLVAIGSAYASYRSERPSLFLGNLLPDVKETATGVVLVCNAAGKIAWCPSEQLRAVSVDGKSPAGLLEPQPREPQRTRDALW